MKKTFFIGIIAFFLKIHEAYTMELQVYERAFIETLPCELVKKIEGYLVYDHPNEEEHIHCRRFAQTSKKYSEIIGPFDEGKFEFEKLSKVDEVHEAVHKWIKWEQAAYSADPLKYLSNFFPQEEFYSVGKKIEKSTVRLTKTEDRLKLYFEYQEAEKMREPSFPKFKKGNSKARAWQISKARNKPYLDRINNFWEILKQQKGLDFPGDLNFENFRVPKKIARALERYVFHRSSVSTLSLTNCFNYAVDSDFLENFFANRIINSQIIAEINNFINSLSCTQLKKIKQEKKIDIISEADTLNITKIIIYLENIYFTFQDIKKNFQKLEKIKRKFSHVVLIAFKKMQELSKKAKSNETIDYKDCGILIPNLIDIIDQECEKENIPKSCYFYNFMRTKWRFNHLIYLMAKELIKQRKATSENPAKKLRLE